MARTIVYLDQSLLSDLAKDNASVTVGTLESLVQTDRVLFPFSWTHWREAQLDTRVEGVMYDVAARLSRGIRFITPALIAAGQAKRAYLRWNGEKGDELERRHGYEHDPDGPISERLASGMRGGRVVMSPEARERSRAIKDLFARSLTQAREERPSATSFEEVKKRYAEESARFYFATPQRQARAGHLDDLVVPMLQYSGFVAEAAVARMGQAPTIEEALTVNASMFEFFRSENCRVIPFIDIESSIYASLEFDEKDREYSPSDMHDIETWSAYLPYVEMAVADKNMHQVLSRRGLAANYGCSVFPNTKSGLQDMCAKLADAS